ncbi:MAG: TonB-dependent receptor [Gammaproteobacteria bacterium]|nr:TonB-dependent receptor [Gammaproteobacteria bacterium]MBU1482388.1 TonB-dependent receptor [Gammaproteobacteria bacterium]
MKQKHLFAALLLAATPLAQAATDSMDEVVVTATRTERTLSETLAHTTVITRKDIENSQVTDVPTLLRSLAGVEIYQSGGIGKQSSLFMRGTNSSHTLVLLDGVRINSATTGATAIDQLMLDQVERIEVVRGNVSSLYGSDAIGGVIQIFTRRGQGEPTFNAQAGSGSYRTRKLSAGYGGKTETAAFNFQASRFITSGYSALNQTIYPNANPDNDGYANTSLSGNWRKSMATNHAVSLSAFDSRGEVKYDNAYGTATEVNISKTRTGKLAVTLEDRFSQYWLSALTRSRGTDELNTLTDGVSISHLKTVNDQWNWQNTVTLDETNTIMVASESQQQRLESDQAYALTERKISSLVTAYTARTETQQLQVNRRQDRYSDFGLANTWLFAYGLQLNPGWRATYSNGTAFKVPTFNDMHAPAGWGANPDLLPEDAHNREWGLHYKDQTQQIDIAYFNNQISNLIAADSSWVMQNIGHARIKGTELAYKSQQGATLWTAAMTWQDPRNELTGALLPKRAKKFGNIGFFNQAERLRWGAELQYSGRREETNGTVLSSYSLFNLTARYDLGKRTDVSLRVDNLFNKNYVAAYGYNIPGRTLFLGLNYH